MMDNKDSKILLRIKFVKLVEIIIRVSKFVGNVENWACVDVAEWMAATFVGVAEWMRATCVGVARTVHVRIRREYPRNELCEEIVTSYEWQPHLSVWRMAEGVAGRRRRMHLICRAFGPKNCPFWWREYSIQPVFFLWDVWLLFWTKLWKWCQRLYLVQLYTWDRFQV